MGSKRINITIPEENLKQINEFCAEEKINKSKLIREAATQYITNIEKFRDIERKKKNMGKAMNIQAKLREKSKLTGGVKLIRNLRDKR